MHPYLLKTCFLSVSGTHLLRKKIGKNLKIRSLDIINTTHQSRHPLNFNSSSLSEIAQAIFLTAFILRQTRLFVYMSKPILVSSDFGETPKTLRGTKFFYMGGT